MAYDKLAEGNRIWDSATDGDITAADMNELHDQLKVMLGPQDMGLTHLGVADTTEWVYSVGGSGWSSQAGATDELAFALPLRAGQVITDIHIDLEVATNGVGGDLLLIGRPITPVAGSPVAPTIVTIDSDVWNGLTDNTATELSYTAGTDYTATEGKILPNYIYWLYISARSAVVCTVYDVMITAQFGN